MTFNLGVVIMFVRFSVSDCNQHQKCNHNTNWNKNSKGEQIFPFIYSLQKGKKKQQRVRTERKFPQRLSPYLHTKLGRLEKKEIKNFSFSRSSQRTHFTSPISLIIMHWLHLTFHSQNLISSSPHCLSYNSYGVSLENLILDQ